MNPVAEVPLRAVRRRLAGHSRRPFREHVRARAAYGRDGGSEARGRPPAERPRSAARRSKCRSSKKRPSSARRARKGPAIELDERDPTPPATATDAPGARETRRARASNAGGPPAPPAKAAPSEPPPLYGAVGDRSAGDLVTTFKRVFPIAVSSDPLWGHVPVGFYAEGDVTFFLDAGGALTHTTASAAAAPAFHAAIARTTQLLQHRLFTAQGATTHLHMIVRVTDKLVNHGAFTIDAAGSFELPSGRSRQRDHPRALRRRARPSEDRWGAALALASPANQEDAGERLRPFFAHRLERARVATQGAEEGRRDLRRRHRIGDAHAAREARERDEERDGRVVDRAAAVLGDLLRAAGVDRPPVGLDEDVGSVGGGNRITGRRVAEDCGERCTGGDAGVEDRPGGGACRRRATGRSARAR